MLPRATRLNAKPLAASMRSVRFATGVLMGLMKRMFGRRKASDDLPPEVQAVFDKVRRLLDDEVAQNELYIPEMTEAMLSGPDVDIVDGAVGEFGRDPRNPIPVNGALGELIYISNLVTEEGSRLMGHRLGSMTKLDVYEVVSFDGRFWDILYFDLYHPRKSRVAPEGLHLSPQYWIFATNYRLDAFPNDINAAVARSTREFIGLPFVGPALLAKAEFERFERSVAHDRRVRAVDTRIRE